MHGDTGFSFWRQNGYGMGAVVLSLSCITSSEQDRPDSPNKPEVRCVEKFGDPERHPRLWRAGDASQIARCVKTIADLRDPMPLPIC